jgi:hypothetical protein
VNTTRKEFHAQNEYVGSEKGNSKPKAKIGSQTGGENEETQSRDQKSGSRGSAAACPDLASVMIKTETGLSYNS